LAAFRNAALKDISFQGFSGRLKALRNRKSGDKPTGFEPGLCVANFVFRTNSL
jgi:hypothetical protein